MRRLLRLLAILGVIVAAAAGVTGWLLSRQAPAGELAGGGWLLHGVVSAAAAGLASVVAAITFLLGIHGLLASEGRRVSAGFLACLGPLLMGLALWATISGWRGRPVPRVSGDGHHLVAGDLAAQHRIPGYGLLGASLAAVAAAFLLVPPDREPDDDRD